MIHATSTDSSSFTFDPATGGPAAPASSSTPSFKPKKKSQSKLIIGVVVFVLLLVGALASYWLVQQNQDIRQQAATPTYTECYQYNASTQSCYSLGGVFATCPAGAYSSLAACQAAAAGPHVNCYRESNSCVGASSYSGTSCPAGTYSSQQDCLNAIGGGEDPNCDSQGNCEVTGWVPQGT